MAKQQIFIIIRWYNREKCLIKKYEQILTENYSTIEIPQISTTTIIFEHGDWLITDFSKIMEYSKIEDINQPSDPGYEIYDMQIEIRY